MSIFVSKVSETISRHDPYAPGMAEKYGTPGKTDNEGCL